MGIRTRLGEERLPPSYLPPRNVSPECLSCVERGTSPLPPSVHQAIVPSKQWYREPPDTCKENKTQFGFCNSCPQTETVEVEVKSPPPHVTGPEGLWWLKGAAAPGVLSCDLETSWYAKIPA